VSHQQLSPPSTQRLAGVDLARGLAVFGMFAAHVGPDPATEGGLLGAVMQLAHGRSSALFAMLAGVSLALMTGRQQPKTGVGGRQAMVRILARAVILLALGTVLTMLDTPVDVIIAYYGVYFLLALPLIRLRALTLAVIAAVLTVVGPLASFVIRSAFDVGPPDGIGGLLLTGTYPAITWMPFVVAGMALGRIDLTSDSVLTRLGLLGPALALLGYGGSWLALEGLGGQAALLAAAPDAMRQLAGEPGGGRHLVACRAAGGLPAQRDAVRDRRRARSRDHRCRPRARGRSARQVAASPGDRRRRHVVDRLCRARPRHRRPGRRRPSRSARDRADRVHPRDPGRGHPLAAGVPPRPVGAPAQPGHPAGATGPLTVRALARRR
jgi:hypothetical protein